MDLTLGFIFLAVFLLSWFLLRERQNLPPGPLGLPLVGAVLLIKEFKKRPVHEVMTEASKKYGDIFSFRIGSQLFVVLNSHDVITEALVKQADVFSSRFSFLSALKNHLKEGRGVINEDYNSRWKTMRRFTLQSLRDFGVGKTSLEEKINEEIVAMSQVFQNEKGDPLNMNLLLQKAVGNVIYGIVFGKRFDYDDPEFNRIRTLLRVLIEGPGIFNPLNFFPRIIVAALRGTTPVKPAPQIAIRAFIDEQIDQHEASFDESNIRDFVDLNIQCTRKDPDAETNGFTKGNLRRVITDLFVAGSDTTSTTLTWAFLLMSEYPDIQKKCQDEIQEVFGDKMLTYGDRDKLPYVEATLKEIQRHSKTVPLSVPHANTENAKLCGYDIPKYTIVLPNLAACGMDEHFFKNAPKFDPDRFLDTNRKLTHNNALVPFSIGPRVCLGEPLARMELFLIFGSLLQRFTFSREDKNKPHSLKSLPTAITNLPQAFKLRVTSRN